VVAIKQPDFKPSLAQAFVLAGSEKLA